MCVYIRLFHPSKTKAKQNFAFLHRQSSRLWKIPQQPLDQRNTSVRQVHFANADL